MKNMRSMASLRMDAGKSVSIPVQCGDGAGNVLYAEYMTLTPVVMYLDLDDFCAENSSWDLLVELKSQIPNLKVNLFTIIGRCPVEFIEDMKQISWIDMIPHGFMHSTSRECQDWDYATSAAYLDYVDQYNLTKGFKAPGWQISDGMYQALLEKEYWVADQAYNNARRPAALKSYILSSVNRIHGHIGHLGGTNLNELSLIMSQIVAFKHLEFGFIKDIPDLKYKG